MKRARPLLLASIGVALSFAPAIAHAWSANIFKPFAKTAPRTADQRTRKPSTSTPAKGKSVASSPNASWKVLARKVGQSEDDRAKVIRALRRTPNLNTELKKALSTVDRPLALEVIGSLEMQNLLPELLNLVPSDTDGFTTLAVNGLMNEKNSDHILEVYGDLLAPSKIEALSAPVIVAMLEPLARMNVKLSRATLLKLSGEASPDLRSGLLYYLRVMALRNGVYQNLDLVTDMTRAAELQVRLQAISISAEILSKPRGLRLASIKTPEELNELCLREPGTTVKEACLSFLATSLAPSLPAPVAPSLAVGVANVSDRSVKR